MELTPVYIPRTARARSNPASLVTGAGTPCVGRHRRELVAVSYRELGTISARVTTQPRSKMWDRKSAVKLIHFISSSVSENRFTLRYCEVWIFVFTFFPPDDKETKTGRLSTRRTSVKNIRPPCVELFNTRYNHAWYICSVCVYAACCPSYCKKKVFSSPRQQTAATTGTRQIN